MLPLDLAHTTTFLSTPTFAAARQAKLTSHVFDATWADGSFAVAFFALEERGTLAQICVPTCGLESIRSWPPTSVNRSFILVSPSPWASTICSGLNPTPESCTWSC